MSAAAAPAPSTPAGPRPPFNWCFNTSCVRGQNLPVTEQVRITAEAGYSGIEPWIGDLRKFVEGGGKLDELARQIADAGLTVASAIGFAPWIVDDEQKRTAGLEELRRDMEMIRTLGGKYIAAPPIGAQQADAPKLDLFVVAERYAKALEVGADIGVTPMVEVWGFSKNLSRLGEAIFVAVEAGRPDACVLPDVYHIHKGGSDAAGMICLSGAACHAFHINDYPEMARDKLTDADRVYPGDGVAPISSVLRNLWTTGFTGFLSLELFNREHWMQDPLTVAKNGMAKLKAAEAAARAE